MGINFDEFDVYKRALKEMFSKDDINIEEVDFDKVVSDLVKSKDYVDGEKYGLPSSYYLVMASTYIKAKKDIDRKLNTKIKEKAKSNEYRVVFIVKSLEEKISVNIPKKWLSRILYAKETNKSEYIITIRSRLDSIFYDPYVDEDDKKNSKVKPRGQLFIAKLRDLVSLYDEMGDSLFLKNVRFSLETDKNDVGLSLRRTLRENPEYFWFYSNGITLLADEVDYTKSNTIRVKKSDANIISVINGAQTISTCANYFYDNSISQDERKQAEKAYVLLRVITVDSENEKYADEKRKLENNISVSLNRQKPIDSEDLAFASDVVYYINSFQDESSLNFSFCRKGESQKDREYLLIDVAKYIMATNLQSPGKAKNAYRGYVLRIKDGTFERKDIFPKFMNEEDICEEFFSQYCLVNISDILYKAFSSYSHDLPNTSDEIYQSAKWLFDSGEYYFISLITRVIFELTKDSKINVSKARAEMVLKILSQDDVRKAIIEQYDHYIISVLRSIYEKNKKQEENNEETKITENSKFIVDYGALKNDYLYESYLIKHDTYNDFANSINEIVRLHEDRLR